MKTFLAFTSRQRYSVANRYDQEFLPAALEVLETPPSPIGMAMLFLICALVTATLAWSYFSRIDVIAIAQGKIQPTGRVKLIQPVEVGKVQTIHVTNGQHVNRGEVLISLESEEAQAEYQALANSLMSYRAEILRRRTASEVTLDGNRVKFLHIAWEQDISSTVQQRENRVYQGDLQQLIATIAAFDAQRKQKEEERERLVSTIVAQEELLATLSQRVSMRDALFQRSAGTKANLLDSIESRQYQEVILKTQKGQKAESEANIQVLMREIIKSLQEFKSVNEQKLAEAEKQADEIEQRLIKAQVKLNHMELHSPIDGTVQALSVTTPGQVLAIGEEVMRIVPDDSPLEIECYLQNKDIAFVKIAQEAIVKIEAFPFTRFGTIEAEVIRIAHDAIPEPDAQQVEGNPAQSNKSTLFAGAQRVQNLVFPINLKLSKPSMEVEGTAVPLSPGMAVSVEIKTGSRRIIDYLLSPLVEVTAQALREK